MPRAASNPFPGLTLLSQPDKLPDVSVYVIYGDDPFLRAEARRLVCERAVGEGDPGLQVTEFDGARVELRDVFDELSLLPFGPGRRVVVVDNADPFISRYRETLEKRLGQPRLRGVLVLRCNSWNRATRLAKLLDKVGCTIDCRTPTARALQSWLPQWAKTKYGKELAADALRALLELVEPRPGLLDQELQKLAVYVGQRQRIQPEDVDAIVAAGRMRTVWELADAVARGDAGAALVILDRLLLAGEYPVAIHAALATQFRRLARAARLILAGTPTRQALKQAGVPPFAIDRSVEQLRHLGRLRLLRLYDLLLHCDLDLKSSDLDPRVALEKFVLTLAAPADAVRHHIAFQ